MTDNFRSGYFFGSVTFATEGCKSHIHTCTLAGKAYAHILFTTVYPLEQ